MSKFLYVYGDDYSALDFERNFNTKEVYDEMMSKGESCKTIQDDNYYIKIKILEFGEVCPDFMNFVLNEMCDYDALKSANIYEVK